MAVLNKHKHGIPAGAVYIGRGSRWGNPFIIGKHGDRDAVCDAYEEALVLAMAEGRVTQQDLATLHGKDLVCFCAPQRCHGDTLAKYAAHAHDQLNQGDLHEQA
jgi:hypothetical protein